MSSPNYPDLGAFPMPEMAEMPAPILSPAPAPVHSIRDDPPLRSSCGQCNQAKVKCSKDRPACRRCSTRNTPCVYGVSLRGIKRPRPDQQPDKASQPQEKKRATSLLSPTLSDTLPTTIPDISTEPTYLPDWNGGVCSDGLTSDDLAGLLSLNTFDAGIADPSSFCFPLDIPDLQQQPPIQPLAAHQVPIPPVSIPLSPISPPGSRDGHSGTMPHASFTNLSSCCCTQNITYKMTELDLQKSRSSNIGLKEFLNEHRANMTLCTTVLNCTDLQHTPGMQLLLQVIALLLHMTAAFDQILQQGDTSQRTQAHSPGSSPSDRRKEQVSQANTLRAELAKLGALIQEFDRRYCSLDSASIGEDTFLLSPLFANLQWKTQTKFDAARSWIPLL